MTSTQRSRILKQVTNAVRHPSIRPSVKDKTVGDEDVEGDEADEQRRVLTQKWLYVLY